MRNNEERLAEAQAMSIEEIASRLGIMDDLKRAGREYVGPCPACGGSDRFGINPDRDVYNCRTCGGGDGIALVRLVMQCDFPAALDFLVGEADLQVDPAERERRKKNAERQRLERLKKAAKARQHSMALAKEIWDQGETADNTVVRQYLEKRGIDLKKVPASLRFHPALRYTHMVDGEWAVLHEGPAMLALIMGPADTFLGCHRTWIDLATASGKAVVKNAAGEVLASKKVLGSKRGGAIRLSGVSERRTTLIMGEGIETTLSALVSRAYPGAAYWCGVDLGNMAGKRLPVVNPSTGKTSTKKSDLPDLEDEGAWFPPPWLKHLIFLEDGDSNAETTRNMMRAGLKRALHTVEGLKCDIVPAGDGVDMNDVLNSLPPSGGADDE